MINCTRRINAINWRLPHNIPSYAEFLQIKTQKENLTSSNYKKNNDVLNRLTESYNNLNRQMPNILQERIKQDNYNFVETYDNSSSDDQREEARKIADKQYKEMVKWRNIYSNLNDILNTFYSNIYE
jgi:RNA processing factor Prp31